MPPRSEKSSEKAARTTLDAAPPEAALANAPMTPDSFEKGIEELETIVQELERGDLTLEESILLFEKGVALSNACRHQLEEAETRVELLMRKGGKMIPEPVADGAEFTRSSSSGGAAAAGSGAATGNEFSDDDSIPF